MKDERRAELMHHLRKMTSREELDGFRAQLRLTGESQDTELFRAMERKADTFRRGR